MKKHVGKHLPHPEMGRIEVKYSHSAYKLIVIKSFVKNDVGYKAYNIYYKQVLNNRG